MIGAIIGDLAAWTWENDHERFYPSLISEKAVLSEYGLSVLATSDALDYNPHMSSSEYQEYIRQAAKSELDNLGINADNVGEISDYAEAQYMLGGYDETHTEYRVRSALRKQYDSME